MTPLGQDACRYKARVSLGYLARLPDDPAARLTRIAAVHFTADFKICSQIRDLDAQGYGGFPVGIAKTLFSFSTDPRLRDAPTGAQRDHPRGAALGSRASS